jgi:hypothetical protein
MVNNYSKIKQAINHLQPQTMKHKTRVDNSGTDDDNHTCDEVLLVS